MTTTTGTQGPPIANSVTAWRYHVLLNAGYPEGDAELLAEWPDVDLHTAVYLIESGCHPQVALRILL